MDSLLSCTLDTLACYCNALGGDGNADAVKVGQVGWL